MTVHIYNRNSTFWLNLVTVTVLPVLSFSEPFTESGTSDIITSCSDIRYLKN